MLKKLIFPLLLGTILIILPLQDVLAYSDTFVYDFDTTLRGKDRKLDSGGKQVYAKFSSVKCRKGHKMTIKLKHNVSFRPDPTLTSKRISECGGTIGPVGYAHNTPVYIEMSKQHDGFWVRGTGKIYTQ
jgi:hypothetical protein